MPNAGSDTERVLIERFGVFELCAIARRAGRTQRLQPRPAIGTFDELLGNPVLRSDAHS